VFMFPLLIIPLAIYNMVVFLMPGVPWDTELVTVPMMSGGQWKIVFSDVLIALTLIMLFFETIKATRSSTRSVIDHMLSTLVFVAALVEFLLVPQCATSTFAMIVLIALIDVIGGYTVSIRTARRDFSIERPDVA
jgi:hypothetical protein